VFGYVLVSLRCLVIVVLAVSAAGKVAHRGALQEFERTLRQGLRLPRARLLAGAWVAAEAGTALLLVLPPTVGFAAVLAGCQFGCLTLGVALLVPQRQGFRCSCFGGSGSELSWWTVLRNGTLTLVGLLLAVGLRQPAAAAPAPVALAAILSVLLGSVLAWQGRPLRALVGQFAARPVNLAGGRR
jgi:hypothetical protein